MALYPCDFHGARYKGPSSAAYPAILAGGESTRKHVRACGPCLTDRIENSVVPIRKLLFDTPADMGLAASRSCPHCKKDGGMAFFLTAYVKGQEEQQYYATVCEDAALKLCEQWGLEYGN